MNPVDNPTAYDTFDLAGQKSPGVCVIGGLAPKKEEGWDLQKAEGSDGAEPIHKGSPPAQFQAQLFLWKDEASDHFATWDKWKPLLRTPSKDGADQKALDIYHPLLDEVGITSVVVKSWTPPIPDGAGGATVTIEFIEYRTSSAKNTGAPNGSKSNTSTSGGGNTSGNGQKEDPNADLKQQFKQRQEEFANT